MDWSFCIECTTGKSDLESFNHPSNVLVSRGCRAFKQSKSSKCHISWNKPTLKTVTSNTSPIFYFLPVCILPIQSYPNTHIKNRYNASFSTDPLPSISNLRKEPVTDYARLERFCSCSALAPYAQPLGPPTHSNTAPTMQTPAPHMDAYPVAPARSTPLIVPQV
jgi:hypothetical protein